jgi:hypothetical protein
MTIENLWVDYTQSVEYYLIITIQLMGFKPVCSCYLLFHEQFVGFLIIMNTTMALCLYKPYVFVGFCNGITNFNY